MRDRLTRRQMIQGTGALLTTAWLGKSRPASAEPAAEHAAAAGPSAELLETKVISHQAHLYHGWPTLTRRRNGQLLLVCSGGREAHVCPFGRVELMRSDDGGKTWGWPRVVMDSEIDDRDAGVLETAAGSILITSFTSLAYESILKRAESIEAGAPGAWPEDKLRRWQAAHRRLSAEERQRALGVWMIRSTDGGVTFSGRYDCRVNSPHGPIQLADGRLLYAGKDLWRGERRVGFCESTDDGQTWRWLATLPRGKATTTRTTTSCTRWRPPTAGSSASFATTTRPTTARPSRPNRPTAARPGLSRGRSVSGDCRRTCCDWATAGC